MKVQGSKFLGAVVVLAGFVCAAVAADKEEKEFDWLTPEVGPFAPSIHINASVGDSSGDPESLAVGHHDPTREDGTVQGIELGLSAKFDYLECFATYTLGYGADEEWSDELEEAFLKLKDLPGGFEVRGGRMLARFGQHNSDHLHAWSFVDMPLVLGTFLSEDGLIYDGGDLTWLSRGVATTLGVTVGYGDAKTHEHDHGHAEDDDHEEDHDDHEEDDDEEEHEESPSFADDVYSGRAFAMWRANDFNSYEAGVSLAVGDDESDRQIAVYGADFAYTWREKGLEAGGKAITWQTEVLFRDTDDAEAAEEQEDDDHGDDDHEDEEDHDEHEEEDRHEHEDMPGGSEFGIYSQVVYSHNANWDLGTRVGYVAGDEDVNTHDRFRVSPAATYWVHPEHASLRLQYNYDDVEQGDNEHSIWLQLGLSIGGGEVR